VEIICERRKSAMGISNGVLRTLNFFSIIISVPHAPRMINVTRYVKRILFNSNNSEVLPQKIRGTRRKRA
jgi:hypothetical protein